MLAGLASFLKACFELTLSCRNYQHPDISLCCAYNAYAMD
jgi:hypothetical protein